MPNPVTVISWATEYGIWTALGLLAIVIIYYLVRVILDEDKSAAWRARIYRALYRISGTSEAEKKYIANDVSSRINLARRKMPFAQEYLPNSLKVQWIEGAHGEATSINDNDLLVRLDPAELEGKNIVLVSDALVKKTSLAGVRHIISGPLELSMDLNLVKNLLKEIGDRRILDWFFRNEYQPVLDQSAAMRTWNGKIVEIDERGLFTRLLLVELDNFSKEIVGKPSSPDMFDEISGLIEFLYKIATKIYGQDVPLECISRNIKIGVILVGETSKLLYEGIDPYLRAFAYKLRQQLDSIYVISFGKDLLGSTNPELYQQFAELTKSLDRDIERRFRISKDFELKYVCTDSRGNKRNAKIARYTPRYEAQ
jgi:hypothetical protein